MEVTKSQLLEVRNRISPFIHKTPLFTSAYLNKLTGSNLFFKAEQFQKTGAFKARGAMNAIQKLKHSDLKGVVTHSSGNHGQALAWAAKQFNIPATVVVPRNVAHSKLLAIAGYEAAFVFCEPTMASRESVMNDLRIERDLHFVPPFDHEDIILGQSTCAQEIFDDCELDYLICPVGGGGLYSGSLLASKFFSPKTKIIGVEPEGANDAYRSLRSGKLLENENVDTICDGLRTNLGKRPFKVIQDHQAEILLVSDEETKAAMDLLWQRMKMLVESNSATVLAAVLKNPDRFRDKKIGLILSGGNVDVSPSKLF